MPTTDITVTTFIVLKAQRCQSMALERADNVRHFGRDSICA